MKTTDSLPPIPTPTSMRWREFRASALPMVVFVGVIGMCALLWGGAVSSQGLMGVADGTRSTLVSLQPGTILNLAVRPFDKVTAGQPLIVVHAKDPRAQLDLLSSDVQLARMGLEPSLHEETQFNADRIQLELLRLRSDLSVARVGLQRAESEVKRSQPLHAEKLVSDDAFELLTKTRDMIQAEVSEKEKAVGVLEARMTQLSQAGGKLDARGMSVDVNQILVRLQASRDSVGTNFIPQVLRAPMAGMVGVVYRQQGENVMDGEPILQINSLWSERVIAYLRQPYGMQPELGQQVLLTTQERRPRKIQGIISHIGAQVEAITNSLAMVSQGKLVDVGLPIVVEIPQEAQIRPGEVLMVHLGAGAVATMKTAKIEVP